MEFFLFGTSVNNGGPKLISKMLADITGYAPLPPYFSLGFHYSKWESLSTDRLN
jgi:alpha-glucosidase (family GH31 glycosyl hydrolase)